MVYSVGAAKIRRGARRAPSWRHVGHFFGVILQLAPREERGFLSDAEYYFTQGHGGKSGEKAC